MEIQCLSCKWFNTFGVGCKAFPEGIPIGLSDEFINDDQKNKQWLAFLRKNALDPMPLATVISDLREFLLPVLATAATSSRHDMAWGAGEGWRKNA